MIYWFSKKHNFVVLSTEEVEYITTNVACHEAVYVMTQGGHIYG
jgi:hypothetical protein